MWFLRPDRHSWMASPPRLAAVCVSAQTFLTQCTHAFIGAMLILVHHQQWIIYVTANSNVQHIALINVKWISDNNDWYQTMINCPNINSKFPSSLHNPQNGPSLGTKNCSAPRVWGFRGLVRQHGPRSKPLDHIQWSVHVSSTSDPRQFHIWSTSVPRPGKPSGDPAAASLIIR